VIYKLFLNPKRKEIGGHNPNTVINVLGERYKEICTINRYATSQSFGFKLRVMDILTSIQKAFINNELSCIINVQTIVRLYRLKYPVYDTDV